MKLKSLIAILIVLIVVLAVAMGTYLWLRPRSILPGGLTNRVPFLVFYPVQPSPGCLPNRSSILYDQSEHVLTYEVVCSGTRITVAEQATPPVFNDSPQVYPSLLQKAHEYASFDSNAGHVSLTRPAELKGGQSAIVLSKGTLLFARPNKNVEQTQWQAFFDSLEVVR